MKSTAFIDFGSVLVFVIKGDAGSPGAKGIKGSPGPPVCQQFVNFLLLNPYKFWGAYQDSFFLTRRVTWVCLVPPVYKDWSVPRWLFCLSNCWKQDKRGFLKMATTLLETQPWFYPPSYFWGCSSNYDPGKSIQQINTLQRESVHLWLNALSVMDFISGHSLSLKNTQKLQWYSHQHFWIKHSLVVSVEFQWKCSVSRLGLCLSAASCSLTDFAFKTKLMKWQKSEEFVLEGKSWVVWLNVRL